MNIFQFFLISLKWSNDESVVLNMVNLRSSGNTKVAFSRASLTIISSVKLGKLTVSFKLQLGNSLLSFSTFNFVSSGKVVERLSKSEYSMPSIVKAFKLRNPLGNDVNGRSPKLLRIACNSAFNQIRKTFQ